jgi:hypothetical protein
VTPAVGLGIGIAYLVAGVVAGNVTFGVLGLAIMVTTAVGLVVASRYSETVRGLLDRRDERIAAMDLRATAIAGCVVIVAILGAFVVEIAQGGDGMPYAWLGALGALAYVLALVVLRLRG